MSTTNKVKKWDMLLLILCMFFFTLFIGSSIYLTNKKNERINEAQVKLTQKKFDLIDLRDQLNKVAQGSEKAIAEFNTKLQNLSDLKILSSSWKQFIDNAENLNIITINRLKNSSLFFKKNQVRSLFNEGSKRSDTLIQSNLYADNLIVMDYVQANHYLTLVENLLYSSDSQTVNKAFTYLEEVLRHEEKIASQINYYPEVKPIHDITPVITGLVKNKNDIIRLVDTSQILYDQTTILLNQLNDTSLDHTKLISTPIGRISEAFIFAGYAFAFIFFGVMVWIIYRTLKERAANSRAIEAQNSTNKEAILEMLKVMKQLSEGDLTAKAVVSDPLTGTLANSFNVSVKELHTLVSALNYSADKVTAAVRETTNLVDRSTDASLAQATQITVATDTVSHVTQAMLDVSAQTSAAVDIANSSTDVARSGSERVRSTITGMDQIREHIQETSKRIKRLGESSQEIGDIVELINDIADQTHILALNAAIQASAAGEAGKGFAVVADEVQRLAERTGNATQRVESLVKTIQTDTHEAIFAMEKSTSEVVNGANLAERAGESLNEIESVSGHLASLIQNVSQASREVSELGTKVKSSMEAIRKLSEQNVDNTKNTKSSVEGLLEFVNELKSSVAGFKIK